MLIQYSRHPRIFGIPQELFAALVTRIIIGWILEGIIVGEYIGKYECFLGIFTVSGLRDMAKAFSFMITQLIITNQASPFFPFPYTWILNDFWRFIQEPICVKVFWRYIYDKEPQQLQNLDDLMQGHILRYAKFQVTSQDGSAIDNYLHQRLNIDSQSAGSKMGSYLLHDSLLKSYDKFKTTRGFHRLYQKLKEFEDICELNHIH